MANQNNDQKYAYLDQLGTRELQELLRADIESPGSGDDEAIFHILEVIEKREQQDPTGSFPDLDKSWKDFQELYNTPEGTDASLYQDDESPLKSDNIIPLRPVKRNRTVRRILIVAAIIACLIAMLTIPVAGHVNLFEMIGQWSAEQFGFKPSPVEAEMSGEGMEDDSAIGASMRETLLRYGIEDHIVPTWMPDGFELKGDLQVQEYSATGDIEIGALYSDGMDNLIFSVIFHSNQAFNRLYEINTDSVEQYVAGDMVHYIFLNEDNNSAAWYTKTLECSFSTTLSKSILFQIIDSIYEE